MLFNSGALVFKKSLQVMAGVCALSSIRGYTVCLPPPPLRRKYLEILQKFGYEGTTIFCEKNCNNKGYAVHIVKLPRHPTVFLTKLSGFAKNLFFVVESAEKTRRWGNIPPSYYYKTVYSLLLLIRQYESDLAPGNSQSDDSSSTRGG